MIRKMTGIHWVARPEVLGRAWSSHIRHALRRLRACHPYTRAISAVVLLMCITGPAFAADKVWSIEDLNVEKEKWPDWIEMPLKVEGRVSAVSRHQFRFVHCELTFRVTEDQSRTVGNARNAEVSGRMKKDKETGKLFFAVDRVKIQSSDVEQFEVREAKLKSTKAEDWYELARWAQSRGKFYEDDELLAKARKTWAKGLNLERANLPANDADARLALAGRLREQQVDASLQGELIHEAARMKWQQAQKDGALDAFAAWLKKTYPEAVQPLDKLPREQSQRYETNPIETFRTAQETDREALWRLFFIQVELARILPTAKPDFSNASAIAEELLARVPERDDLVEKYREQSFQWRIKSIAGAKREEALRVAEDLKSRDQPDEAKKLLRGWLRAQESRFRKDGPIGLMQLAEDYLQLANDEPAAVKLLAEAHTLDPSFSDPGERLKQLGYHLEQNRWIKGNAPDMPANADKSPSQLAVGMTAQAVLLLLGEPTGKTRVITNKGTQEVWSFGHRGTPRLMIYLQQPANSEKAHVTRFLTENQ
jgi:hypothetical protein